MENIDSIYVKNKAVMDAIQANPVAFKRYYQSLGKKYGYGFGDNDYARGYKPLDEELSGNLFRIASYNFKNDRDYDFGGLDYDPTANDDAKNEIIADYYKKNKRRPTDQEYQSEFNRRTYKDQYDLSTVEDNDAYSKGLAPFKIQQSQKAAEEYNQLMADIRNGTLKGQDWRKKYTTLAAYDTYAKDAANKAAAADEKAKQKYIDDTGDTSLAGYKPETTKSSILPTKKEKASPIDTDTLKRLGWDEKTGFDWIDKAILDRQQAVNDYTAATKAPQQGVRLPPAQPLKFGQVGTPNFRQLESATNQAMREQSLPQAKPLPKFQPNLLPATTAAVQRGQAGLPVARFGQQGTPNFSQLEGNINQGINTPQAAASSETKEQRIDRYRREAMGVWGGKAPDWIPDWLIDIAGTANEFVTPNLPQNLIQTYGIDTVSTGLKNAYDAARNTANGDPLRWQGNLTASGWKNAPSLPQWVIEDAQREMAANPVASQKYKEAEWALNLASSPAGGTILSVIGDALFDPTTYVGVAEVADIVKYVKANKIDDAARIAQKVISNLDEAPELAKLSNAMNRRAQLAPTLPQARPLTTVANAADNVPTTAPKTAPTIARGASLADNATTPATRAAQAATEPTARSIAAAADDGASLTMTPTKAKPAMEIGTPGQKSFDAQVAAPEGMAERGLSENIRTDANSPDALRETYSADPEFYKVVTNKDTLAKAQAVYDTGAQNARAELVRLTDAMKPEAVPLAKMLARDAMAAGDTAGARSILSDVASKLTEAGQFGQAAKILRQSDPETVLMTLDKQLKKLNTDGAKVYGKRWKDFDLLSDELDALKKINPGDEPAIEAFMNKVSDRIAGQMPATALEKLTAWRHMSMLLNPKTHIRNVTGNALMYGMERTSNRLSGFMQKLLPKSKRTASVWVGTEYKKLARDFFAKHEKELFQGGNKYNEGIGLNMPNKRVFKAKPLEAARKFNYKALDKEDKFFFRQAYLDTLASSLSARKIKAIDDIPNNILKRAVDEAEKAVFRDKSKLATAINNLKQSKGGFVVDTVLPFTKTPINIARRGLDFSPVGVGKGISKLFKADTAAEGIDDLAKGLTGTGVVALGYYLASQGILTGAAPKDKDLAAYEKATGNAPFTFTPAGITYDWAQPAAIPLAVGVAIFDALEEDPQAAAKMRKAIEAGDTETVNKLAGFYGLALLDGFAAAGDTMFNMSVLQGIQDLFGNPQGITAGLAELPGNYINQNIPTVFGQAARSIDPTIRQTNFGRSTPADLLKTQAATVINKIPFASTALPPKITPFGQEQRGIENPFLRTLQNIANPGNTTTPQEIDPQVDAEIRRLYEVGQLKQFPTTVDRTFKFMDRSIGLTDAEYTQYQRTTGQQTIIAYKDIINSNEYKKMPPKELTTRLKALAAKRGTTVELLRNDPKVVARIQEEYRAFLLTKGIEYAKALGQLEILKKRGLVGNLTDKQLADRMGVSQDTAKQIN